MFMHVYAQNNFPPKSQNCRPHKRKGAWVSRSLNVLCSPVHTLPPLKMEADHTVTSHPQLFHTWSCAVNDGTTQYEGLIVTCLLCPLSWKLCRIIMWVLGERNWSRNLNLIFFKKKDLLWFVTKRMPRKVTMTAGFEWEKASLHH